MFLAPKASINTLKGIKIIHKHFKRHQINVTHFEKNFQTQCKCITKHCPSEAVLWEAEPFKTSSLENAQSSTSVLKIKLGKTVLMSLEDNDDNSNVQSVVFMNFQSRSKRGEIGKTKKAKWTNFTNRESAHGTRQATYFR